MPSRRKPSKRQKTKRSPRKRTAQAVRDTELSVADLRWTCSAETIGVHGTNDVKPLTDILGQDRAMRALKVGLEVHHPGYNIFVTGAAGTGRTSAIKATLHTFESRRVTLSDICYVHNFHDPDTPRMIGLTAGAGSAFKKDMAAFLADLKKSIPAVFESKRYAVQRKSTLELFQDRQRSVLRDFERRVKERGFEVVQVQGSSSRPEIAYVMDETPTSIEQLQTKVDEGKMPQEELLRITNIQAELEGQMDVVMREMRNIERKAKRSVDDLNTKVVVPIVEELLWELRQKYPSQNVSLYLNEVQTHILSNLSRFHTKEDSQPQGILGMVQQKEDDPFTEYQVNVVVDNSGSTKPPVVIENNPRYKNLFGTIERVVDKNGVWHTNFLHIKGGSLAKANGGFLVLNALDALTEPGVWPVLKRVLRNKQLEIQPIESGLLGTNSGLKPEPIDLDVKVIMIGDPYLYHTLYEWDEDFQKIFKVRADFDTEMPNVGESVTAYMSFMKAMCERESLLPLDAGAMAEVAEEGARLAGRKKKLSTRFSVLADILREADYWGRQRNAESIERADVRAAVDHRIDRLSLIEEKVQEMIDDGSIMIETSGSVVGQVNGLSVYMLDEFEFGKPTRITVRTGMGRSGIINIERESDLSGPTHDKGVLILTGYLLGRFAKQHPLVLTASIAFEQSYSGVDGDSASSTEIYALLSSLSDIPLRQDIAVTGSVNQHGEIQPIGGVNQKIEGFFDVCRSRGLTGNQGVMIPVQNVPDLMLRHDVVSAVKKGSFHIYAVKNVDEGIALLTGRPAGTQTKAGTFTPANSVNALVDRKLTWLTKHARRH
jgi:ATP-dependent Lon protease